MSEQIPLATLKLVLAPGYGLEELQLQSHDQAVIDAYAQIYGQVAQLAAAGADFSHLAPALHKATVDALTSAFTTSGLATHDFTAEIVQQANTTIQDLQGQLANLQTMAQASVNEAYAKGRAEGEASVSNAAATQGHTGGGVSLHIDTAEIARQIAAHLGGQVAMPAAAHGLVGNGAQQAATPTQTVAQTPAMGGITLGKKPEAGNGGSSLIPASDPQHPAYQIDPSLVGDGSGAGGGMTNDELQATTGAPTVAAVRASADMHKVGLPTAKKQFSVGAKVYIVPSSEAAQWDGKPCVVADPAGGGDLEAIAEHAKSLLTKNLHYYVMN